MTAECTEPFGWRHSVCAVALWLDPRTGLMVDGCYGIDFGTDSSTWCMHFEDESGWILLRVLVERLAAEIVGHGADLSKVTWVGRGL